jgi:molecular chaperone GrpE
VLEAESPEEERADPAAAAADSLPDPADMPAGAAVADSAAAAAEVEGPAAEAVAALEKQLADQRDKYVRLYAEYENFRRRAVRERQDAELRGMGLLIRGLLDALDDLGRFAHLDPGATDTKTVVDGVELVERKLLKALSGHGLEVVNPVGRPFDPAFHEALTTVPAASADEDHVVGQVYQVGYLFNGQLLRAARVMVKQWVGPREDTPVVAEPSARAGDGGGTPVGDSGASPGGDGPGGFGA